jgi:hypothetical protein
MDGETIRDQRRQAVEAQPVVGGAVDQDQWRTSARDLAGDFRPVARDRRERP